ncbi:MAG TPA: phosphoribosylanthranilate isomerase, partial [Gillisia sp.]|nr:phosphoribosylanthranilate isomerase [Gillisia sp.]
MKTSYLNSANQLKVKLKICGMGAPGNIKEIASLEPDFLGFIFYENSPRNFIYEIPEISERIIKTGVFVNASESFIIEKIQKFNLGAVQLHGGEDAEYCQQLKLTFEAGEINPLPKIIKVFSIKDEFDFRALEEFEEIADYFLFDTKGENKGGNGYPFNWDILKNYPSTKPFFLSGGIGNESLKELKSFIDFFKDQGKPGLLYAMDVNSKFEISP